MYADPAKAGFFSGKEVIYMTCLQEKLGSCAGCGILEITAKRINTSDQSIENAITAVESEYCPKGSYIQKDHIKPTKRGSMGVQDSSIVRVNV